MPSATPGTGSPPEGPRVPGKVRVLDLSLDRLSIEELLKELAGPRCGERPVHVITANVDHAVMQKEPELLAAYARAEYTVADGVPLLWAARFLGTPLRGRVNGTDLFVLLCEKAAQVGKSVFLLGAPAGVAREAALQLQARYPHLRVAGTFSPGPGFESDEAECSRICRMIDESGAAILFTALGSPKGIRWIDTHRRRYRAAVSVEVGASFSFVSGRLPRAPVWMQRGGLEWFWRLLHEPRRLWKRYLVRDMPFFHRVLRQKALQKRQRLQKEKSGL